MKNTRNCTLDMLKVFATILIVFHHYQQDAQGITGQNFSCFVNFYGGTFYFGYMVELFFLISGMCMFPYIQKIAQGLTFYEFYARRAARLLPLMAVSGAVSAVLLVFYNKIYSGNNYCLGTPSLFGVLIQSLGVHDGWVFSNPSLNNPTWYCSVLMLCYAIFFGIVYWSGRFRVSPVFGMLFFMFLGCGINTYGINLPFLNSSSSRGFYGFFAGVLLATVMPKLQAWRYSAIASLLIVVLFFADFRCKNGSLEYLPFLLTFVLYPVLMILLQSSPLRRGAGAPFWGKWAKITYSVFIWHFPAYLFVFLLLPLLHIDPASVANQTCMVLFACLMQPIGWFSYRFLEKPWNRKMLNWLLAIEPGKQESREATV